MGFNFVLLWCVCVCVSCVFPLIKFACCIFSKEREKEGIELDRRGGEDSLEGEEEGKLIRMYYIKILIP